MIYGEAQYYNDELKSWIRILGFHKSELRVLLSQLNVSLDFPAVSLAHIKLAQGFTDQLMVSEQQLDHAYHHVSAQVQRINQVLISSAILDEDTAQRQEGCRKKVRGAEQMFIKLRYSCALFLSDFFQPASVSSSQPAQH